MQVSHILIDSGATVLISSGDRLSLLAGILPATDVADALVVDGGVVQAEPPVRVHPWEIAPVGVSTTTAAMVDGDAAAILYTSGSTGKPKGVVLSQRNLVVGAESVSTYLRNTSADVILSVLPLSFDAGFSQVTTAVRRRCALCAGQLSAAAGCAETVREVRCHRTHVRAATVAAARRCPLADGCGAASALLGEHRRADAADRCWTVCARSSLQRRRTSCTA